MGADTVTATPLNAHLAPIGRRPRLGGAMIVALFVAALAAGAGLWSWYANEPAFTAVLSAPSETGGAPMFKARLEPRRHRVMLTPLSPAPERGRARARELWLTPQGGFPHAAGLIDPNRTSPLRLPPALVKAAGQKASLGVTVEPAGGSPMGLPSGPMIAQGALSGG